MSILIQNRKDRQGLSDVFYLKNDTVVSSYLANNYCIKFMYYFNYIKTDSKRLYSKVDE